MRRTLFIALALFLTLTALIAMFGFPKLEHKDWYQDPRIGATDGTKRR